MRVWAVLRGRPAFTRVLVAGFISQLGDWILTVGLTYYVYDATGSTLVSSGVLLAALLPQLVLGSVAGVFVDRWDRPRTVVVTNVAMALALLPLLLVDGDTVWPVYPVLLVINCLEQFFAPAEQALVPALVPDEELVTANALSGQAAQLARLAGGAAGGVAAGVGGIDALVVLDLATYVAAAMLVAGVRVPRPGAVARVGRSLTVVREWAQGLRTAWEEPTLRLLLVVAGVTAVGEGLMGVLFAPFVRDELGGSAAAYGSILSVQALGGIISGSVVALVGHRFSARALYGWGLTVFGLLDLGLFLFPLVYVALWPAFVLIGLVGLPAALTTVGFTTLMQVASQDEMRGRVFGALFTVRGAGSLLGVVLAGYLGEAVGIIPVLAWQGVAYLAAGILAVVLLRRERRP